MARPEREDQVPAEARAAFDTWRRRVLSWPAPVDHPPGLRVSDMPEAWQQKLITDLLVAKALRNKPDHWANQIVDLGDG